MEKQNILVIVSDTFRPDFLPIYGCTAIDTPEIDALAAKGRVFTNAVAASTVCIPSRSSMLTGRFVSDHDAWTNYIPCRKGVEYLPKRLKDAGYDTAGFGIIDVTAAPGDDPCLGFDTLCPFTGRADDNDPYFRYLKSRHPEVTRVFNGHNFVFDFAEEDFHDYWIASEANTYFDAYGKGKREKPFFAYVSFFGPHYPHWPPKELHGCVREECVPPRLMERETPLPLTAVYRRGHDLMGMPNDSDAKGDRIGFMEQIVEVDRQIGRIRKKLSELGLWENTAVVLTADHGCTNNDFGLVTKGPYPYASQLFVPLVVSNCPGVPAGTLSDALVGNIDLGATLLQIAGDERPFGVSRSLLTIEENERDYFYSEFCDTVKTVVDKRYTFSYYPFTGERELYDRATDKENCRNLSGKPEYAARELTMLGKAMDFMIVAKGVRVESKDLLPERQEGIRKTDPGFPGNFSVAFPLDDYSKAGLAKAGLDTHFNDFCQKK